MIVARLAGVMLGSMVWAVLAFLGVPLWVCAAGITVVIVNNRRLRKRFADVPARVRRGGKKRWTRGHAIWVSDVFAFRGSPAAWREDLDQIVDVALRNPDSHERKKLHRLGEGFVIATLEGADGEVGYVAVRAEHRSALLGPFAASQRSVRESRATPSVQAR